MGEWSRVYGSQATRRKVYVGPVTNWFAKIGVVEVQVDAVPLHRGDTVLFIGHTTGMLEMKVEELRVDLEAADEAPQGVRCSLPVPPADGHPRRGDKMYVWKEDQTSSTSS